MANTRKSNSKVDVRNKRTSRDDKSFVKEDRNQKPDKSGGRDFISSTGKPTNDPSWYVNNPVLSRDVGSIWFSRPTGQQIEGVDPSATIDYSTFEPGIAIFKTMLTWGGITKASYDGLYFGESINLTAAKLYQYVVHANSRNTTYDAKDLMLSIMAIDGVYQTITEAIRAYRFISMYSIENRYIGRIVKALGWDIDDLKSNVAEFRYYINYAINRVNKFFMPKLFDMLKSHVTAYQFVYLDRPSIKGQIYCTIPTGAWIYDDINGSLNYVNAFVNGNGTPVYIDPWETRTGNGHGKTLNTFKQLIDRQISAIESSQYMGVMQGDMLKAFGIEGMAQYAYIGIDEPMMPVYDEEFLYKIHNGLIGKYIGPQDTRPGSFDGLPNSSYCVYRDTNAVDGYLMCLHGDWNITGINNRLYPQFIDLPAGMDGTPDKVLLMTLYKQFPNSSVSDKWELSDGSAITCYVGNLNPEVIIQARIAYTDGFDLINSGTVAISSRNADSIACGFASRYHVFPRLDQPSYVDGGGNTIQPPPIWNTDNVCHIDYDILTRCNHVCLWSLFSSGIIANAEV